MVAFAVLALALGSPAQAAADVSSPAAYHQAVQDALALARNALPNDTTTAQQALKALEAGTGFTETRVEIA